LRKQGARHATCRAQDATCFFLSLSAALNGADIEPNLLQYVFCSLLNRRPLTTLLFAVGFFLAASDSDSLLIPLFFLPALFSE